ncbi:hypothetical protein J3A83DRAFT_4218300 [Scleroderma citrinum]
MGTGRNTGPPYQATHFVVSSQVDYGARSSVTHIPCERDALNGSGRRRTGNSILIGTSLVLLAVMTFSLLFETIAHAVNQCPLSYEARAYERQGWQREVVTQEHLREEWEREKLDQNILRQAWREEVDNHLKRQEEQRKAWEIEVEDHRREMDEQRLKWKQEWEDHDRLERERRQKMNMFWGEVEGHQCISYATREYTALLKNLPTNYPYRIEACKETPLEIHGVSYLPKDCEDKGKGGVIGRWEVDQSQPDCVTYWGWFKDKGCTSKQSGKRRFEHYLENLPKGADWREFCATTPVSFLGMHFSGAQICFQWGSGAYGEWDVEDHSC